MWPPSRNALLALGAAGSVATFTLLGYLYLQRRNQGSTAATSPPTTQVLLVDNGSLRPQSYLSLCDMAAAVSASTGIPVTPASARFADKLKSEDIGGRKGEILAGAVRRLAEAGHTDFVILPAFLGPSDTLKTLVPTTFATLSAAFPRITFTLGAPLVVVAEEGDTRVAQALAQGVLDTMAAQGLTPKDTAVVLCDHGSPHADVAAVRGHVAGQLGAILAAHAAAASPPTPFRAPLAQASMERRQGPQYDFCEPMLAKVLASEPYSSGAVVLALLFLSPGAHAGPGGDIAEIVEDAVVGAGKEGRALSVFSTPLLGPKVTGILAQRLLDVTAGKSG